MKGTIFLRIPIKGGGYEFVKNVDTDRLNRGTHNDLFQLASKYDGVAGQKRPIADTQFFVNQGLDISELQACLEEGKAELRQTLESFGEHGQKMISLFDDMLDQIGQVVTSLSKEAVALATTEASTLIYTMMGAGTEIAQQLDKAEQRSSLTRVYEQAWETQDESIKVLYSQWGEALLMLLKAANEITALELELNSSRELIRESYNNIVNLVSVDNGNISSAIRNFCGNSNGFLHDTQNFATNEAIIDKLDSVEQSEQLIDLCRRQENEAQQLWTDLQGLAQSVFPSAQSQLPEKIANLKEAHRNVDFYRSQLQGGMKPYQVPSPVITEVQFNQAETIMADPEWTRERLIPKFSKLFGQCLNMIEERPELPEQLTTRLVIVERRVDQINNFLEDSTAPSEPVKLKTLLQPVPGSAQQIGEIYELVMCVAYISTCNTTFMAGSHLGSFIDLLARLGKVDKVKIEPLLPAVRHLVDSDREIVRDGKAVAARWEKSESTWISYNVNSKVCPWRVKLTRKGGQNAFELMAKHGLDEELIRLAMAERKSDEGEKFRRRKTT